MSADLYALLGVDKSASPAEIAKAYKRQALIKHPDRGGSTEEFQQLQKAHEVLSNPEQRAYYDQTGQMPGDGANSGGGPDLSQMFGAMFGGAGGMPFPFFMPGAGGPPPRIQKGPNKHHDIGVSLADLYNGKQFTLQSRREVLCKGCDGRGGKELRPCGGCGGRGMRLVQMQMGPIISVRQEACETCQGRGQEVAVACDGCGGKRVVEEAATVSVVIEPGMREGDRLVFPELCSESPQFEKAGDLILVLRASTTDDPAWVRDGDALGVEVEVSVAESLLGWERVLTGHPCGKTLHLVRRGAVSEGTVLVVEGRGMPVRSSPNSFGNLHIVCRVSKHKEPFSPEQVALLRQVWPDCKEPEVRVESYVLDGTAGA
jgi:DnaJ family protein A protein 2